MPEEPGESRPNFLFRFLDDTMRSLPFLLPTLLVCGASLLLLASPSSSRVDAAVISPFNAASYHLQQEYDRFANEELRFALLSGAKAVRTDLVLRDREKILQRMTDEVPDTVPADVNCERTKHCDKNNVCAIVCNPGSVVMDKWLQQSLRLQRKVAYERNFCNAQLPGSHNSAINIADVSFLWWLFCVLFNISGDCVLMLMQLCALGYSL